MTEFMSEYFCNCRVDCHLIVELDVHFNHATKNNSRHFQMSDTTLDRPCAGIGGQGCERQIDLLTTWIVVGYERWSKAFVNGIHAIPAGDTRVHGGGRNT